MNIAHCIASIDNSTGGPARSSTILVEELLKINGVSEISLLTLKSLDPIITDFESKKGSIAFYEPNFGGTSKDLRNALGNLDKIDIFHGHGIWDLAIHQMAICARKKKLPYILSIRGMLEGWSLEQSKIKKRLAMFLYQNKDLFKAACLHATALSEAEAIRRLGYKNPIAVIPNGINLSDYPVKESILIKEKRKILFLSRIHPKKGIELLIDAWEGADEYIKAGWEIEIVGNGESDYVAALQKIIRDKDLQKQIKIVGPKFGLDKIAVYHSADLFVLPTYSENFGIVIAEALACGIPVITTKGTPWQELEEYNAGKWIDVGVDFLRNALEETLIQDNGTLIEMGRNGRKLIEEKYSIESVAVSFVKLYEWILNRKDKPEFVYI
ncbi:glycosyltransferase [Sphingobacterium siyangense]|uniref:glycosyltransferase n=1 Tax=Sphingobacterium siyangense TaxID=459529 RepID=UPI003DA423B8